MRPTGPGQTAPPPGLRAPSAAPGGAGPPAGPGPPAQGGGEPGLQLRCEGLDPLHHQGAVTRARAGQMEDPRLLSGGVLAGPGPALDQQASSGRRKGENIDLN